MHQQFVRLSDDALNQRHDKTCGRLKPGPGPHHCDCLVAVVQALQRELDGRNGWRIMPDLELKNAATVQTPGRNRLRLTCYPDGRLRLKVQGAGPLLVQDAGLTGRGADVNIVLVPEGWRRPPEEIGKLFIIGYIEKPGGATLYYPRRHRPDLPIKQQWEPSRPKARTFSTEQGAKTVIQSLMNEIPTSCLSVIPMETNLTPEGPKEGA